MKEYKQKCAMNLRQVKNRKAVTTKDFLKKMQDKQNRKNFRLVNQKSSSKEAKMKTSK